MTSFKKLLMAGTAIVAVSAFSVSAQAATQTHNLNDASTVVLTAGNAAAFAAPAAGTDEIISVADGVNVGDTGVVVSATTADGVGTLSFLGSSTATGTVGAVANRVGVLSAGIAGKTVTVTGDVYAGTISVAGTGTLALGGNTKATTVAFGANDGVVTIADGKSLTADVTANAGVGTLTLSGTSTVTGIVATATNLKLINAGATGKTATFSGVTKATAVNFTGNGAIVMNGALTGAVTTDTNGYGDLTLAASTTVGQIGTGTKALGGLKLAGDVTSSGAVYADEISLGLNTLTIGAATTVASGQSVNFSLDTADNGLIAGGTKVLTLASGSSVILNVTDAELTDGINASYTIASGLDAASAVASTIVSNVPGYRFTAVDNGATFTVTSTALTAAQWTDDDRVLNSIIRAAAGTDATVLANVQALQVALANETSVTARNERVESARPTVDGSSTVSLMDAAAAVQGVADTRMASLRTGDVAGVAAGDKEANNSFWMQGYYNYANQDVRDGIDGYESDTAGLMLGVDTKELVNGGVLGLAVNYGATNADSENANATETEIDNYGLTFYGAFDMTESTFVEGQAGYAFNDISTTRTNCGAATGVCSGDTESNQYAAKLAVGYDYAANKGMTVTPKAYASYVTVETDGYSETGTGAGATPLTVGSVDVEALDIGLDVTTAWEVQARDGVMKPSFNVGYAYDAIGDQIETTSSFLGVSTAGTSFVTTGPEAAKSKFNVGVGFAYETNADWDVSAKYDAVVKEDYYAHNGSVRFTTHF